MRHTEIAIAKPFEGAPKVNFPDIYGASPNKPIIIRIPVTGKRPIKYFAENLPEGLLIKENIITGKVKNEGTYEMYLCAENEYGTFKKKVVLEIKENNILLTPLMGFTSWNAFGTKVSQEKMISVTQKLVNTGICEYGYSYVNLDSGWQYEYGGKYDAIMPNDKFPDIKGMCDEIHSYGLKCGIYSTPMITAFGCPEEFKSIPGCTMGEPDPLFSLNMGGIGKIRKEANNVKQWTEWGFDYLKYDWCPTDTYNAELMRRELIKSDRDFGYSIATRATPEYVNYWSSFANSYRNNADSLGDWDNFIRIFKSYDDFVKSMKKGHFFDLDMLDTGTCEMIRTEHIGYTSVEFTEDEQICVYSARAFMGSPIQISSTLEDLDEFELSLYCNEEVIAINQDTLFSPPIPCMIMEGNGKNIRVFKRKLSDGSFAIAIFNLGDKIENVKVYLDDDFNMRDVWAKKDVGKSDIIDIYLHSHTVKIYKLY